jgi:hypothetical protein
MGKFQQLLRVIATLTVIAACIVLTIPSIRELTVNDLSVEDMFGVWEYSEKIPDLRNPDIVIPMKGQRNYITADTNTSDYLIFWGIEVNIIEYYFKEPSECDADTYEKIRLLETKYGIGGVRALYSAEKEKINAMDKREFLLAFVVDEDIIIFPAGQAMFISVRVAGNPEVEIEKEKERERERAEKWEQEKAKEWEEIKKMIEIECFTAETFFGERECVEYIPTTNIQRSDIVPEDFVGGKMLISEQMMTFYGYYPEFNQDILAEKYLVEKVSTDELLLNYKVTLQSLGISGYYTLMLKYKPLRNYVFDYEFDVGIIVSKDELIKNLGTYFYRYRRVGNGTAA